MPAKVLRAAATEIHYPMRMPDGRAIVFVDLDLGMTVDEGVVRRLTIEASVPHEVYELIDDLQLFHLEPEHRGAFAEGAFDPDREVQLELELASPLVQKLVDDGVTNAAIAIGELMRLADRRDPDEPLLDNASWYAINVKQARGNGLATGYSTTWARADHLG